MHVPLSELGTAEATGARDALAERPLTAIWSSDLLRATQTSRIIAQPHALDVTEAPALREVALGALEGRSYDDLVPEPTPAGMHTSDVPWGGGESLADVAARLRPLLDELLVQFGDDDEVVLTSHADTLRVLITLIEGGDQRSIDWDRYGSWPNAHIESRSWPPAQPPASGRPGGPA